jgi:hydroxyacylglutathione hydrolase
LKIIKIPAGIYGANSYIVYSENTNISIVIDPGGDAETILKNIKDNNLDVKYIVLTHGHGDHIGAVEDLRDTLNTKLLIHEDDVDMIKNPEMNLSNIMGGAVSLEADEVLKDGDKVQIGELEAEVIHTPGHTRGGICLKIGKYLFTGDTLFKGSIGRSDLIGGDYDTLINSINNNILVLEDNIVVLPGHGENSTIGEEKILNPYLK